MREGLFFLVFLVLAVLVVVIAVLSVAVSIVDVIYVVAVLDNLVAAVLAMLVLFNGVFCSGVVAHDELLKSILFMGFFPRMGNCIVDHVGNVMIRQAVLHFIAVPACRNQPSLTQRSQVL